MKRKIKRKIKKKISRILSRILYKYFHYDTKIIQGEDYYENGKYVITEPRCMGCGLYTQGYKTHKPYKRVKYFSLSDKFFKSKTAINIIKGNQLNK